MNLIATIWDAQLWYAIPMMIAISLVYGATRHEQMREIFRHSLSALIWLSAFLGIIFVIVWFASTRI